MIRGGFNMRFNNVLLLFPDYLTRYGVTHAPVGLGYLSEVLQLGGTNHRIMDLRFKYSDSELKNELQEHKPDLIGLSLMSLQFMNHYRTIRKIREFVGDTAVILVGGPHVSALQDNVLKACPEIDLAITGEGEPALMELCRGEDLSQIAGLLYRKNGEVCFTGERSRIIDLDSIPFPTYNHFELNRYVYDEVPIVSSRGCPFTCTFCSIERSIGRKWIPRSADNVVDEIEFWYELGKRRFAIVDDCFTTKKSRIFEFADRIEKRGLKGLHFRSPNGLRADCCDKDMLDRMKSIGWEYIAFGVESANETVRRLMRKHLKIEAVCDMTEYACRIGLDVVLFFIVGCPGEDWAALEESVNLAQKYPIFDAKFFNAIPFPGSDLYEYVKNNNLFIRDSENYLNDANAWDSQPVFVTAEMDLETRIKALKYTKRVRYNIRKVAIQRRFERLPILNILISKAYMSDFLQENLLKSKLIRRIGVTIYDWGLRTNSLNKSTGE